MDAGASYLERDNKTALDESLISQEVSSKKSSVLSFTTVATVPVGHSSGVTVGSDVTGLPVGKK